jgi:phosphoglucosamine mutase
MILFGTDGIRGKAEEFPLDANTVKRVGAALVRAGDVSGRPMRVLVGRDTRESGAAMESWLAAGVRSEGGAIVSGGVLPTPAIAYLTRSDDFDAGIVISASHNPFEDNGIKVFGPTGEKIPAAYESAIEAMVADATWQVEGLEPPRLEVTPDLARHYVEHLRQILGSAGPLTRTRIVLDCANGATYAVAPALFAELGFDVDAIAVTPDGRNINLNCGSTHLEGLRQRVRETGARLGIAFDGDGDRALFVDRYGEVVDGDAVLLMAAEHLQRHGRLKGNGVVATVMSNIGLEIALGERGIEMVRCPVGDKYVMEEMQRRDLALGGEQSGHVIFAEHLMTGDGIGTALQVLRIMAETGRDLAELASALVSYPQVLVNVRVKQRSDYMRVEPIAAAVRKVESSLDGQGRLLIRYSGTEPLLRIMIEGKRDDEIKAWAEEIAMAIRTHLA